jgi:uncharacterized repeat protein (TIGR04052 family)
MKFSKHYLPIAVLTSFVLSSLDLWYSVRVQAQDQTPQNVIIRFQAKVGNQPFNCGKSYSLGKPAIAVTPTDYRFYISNVALVDNNGKAVPLTLRQDGKWQFQNVALLDFENKTEACTNGTSETNSQIVGTIAPGTYQGLQLTLGVPSKLNHADATLAASPLNLTSLWWNWQGGYKFMRIDLTMPNSMEMKSIQANAQEPEHHNKQTGFSIHLGSTGCQTSTNNSPSGTCVAPNLATMTFPNFDSERNTIVADLALLTANTNLNLNQPNTPTGCMSSPTDSDCAGIMAALGLPFNGNPVRSQTFLTVD